MKRKRRARVEGLGPTVTPGEIEDWALETWLTLDQRDRFLIACAVRALISQPEGADPAPTEALIPHPEEESTTHERIPALV